MQFEVVSEEAKTAASLNGKQPPGVVFVGLPLVDHRFASFSKTSYQRLGQKSRELATQLGQSEISLLCGGSLW